MKIILSEQEWSDEIVVEESPFDAVAVIDIKSEVAAAADSTVVLWSWMPVAYAKTLPGVEV